VGGAVSATVVAASSGKRITVHALTLGGSGGTGLWSLNELTSAGATVTTQMVIELPTGTSLVWPYSQYPWATVAVGNALCIALSSAGTLTAVGGIIYMQG
jgi:hypothetical protein